MSIIPSCVKSLGGVPTLYVNNQPVAQTAYLTYVTANNDYASFARQGYRLFSMPVYFATRTMSEVSQMRPLAPGLFENETDDFEPFDQDVRRILDVCPDAMIFPRVNVNTTISWDEAHPDELEDQPYNEAARRRPCYASDLWAEEVKRLLTRCIRHVQASSYAANIVGYQIAGGNTDEWFPFDHRGSIGKRSRENISSILLIAALKTTNRSFIVFINGCWQNASASSPVMPKP